MPEIGKRGPGAQEGEGSQSAQALGTRFDRSESAASFGNPAERLHSPSGYDWKGSIVAVIITMAWALRSCVR